MKDRSQGDDDFDQGTSSTQTTGAALTYEYADLRCFLIDKDETLVMGERDALCVATTRVDGSDERQVATKLGDDIGTPVIEVVYINDNVALSNCAEVQGYFGSRCPVEHNAENYRGEMDLEEYKDGKPTGNTRTISAVVYESAEEAMNSEAATTTDLKCLSGYIAIPANASVGVQSAFCVMAYEARSVDQIPTSQGTGTPWTYIGHGSADDTTGTSTAVAKCRDLGTYVAGGRTYYYHLITNAEWQAIARNIESVGSNWSGGAMGSGDVNQGHSDGSPNHHLSASEGDPCQDTEQTCSASAWNSQRRTHVLSTGDVIWDFAGNVWEFIMEEYYLQTPCPEGKVAQLSSASITDSQCNRAKWRPLGDYSVKTSAPFGGLGSFVSAGGSGARGGNWGDEAGIFAANLAADTYSGYVDFGFRCALSIP